MSKVNKTENKIKSKRKEEFYAFDDTGDIIFHKKGTKEHIPFTNFDVLDMKSNKVKVITHNHPPIYGKNGINNATFSFKDIELAMKWDLPQMRAVGRDKVFIFRQGKNAMSGGIKWEKNKKKISKLFEEAEYGWVYDDAIVKLHKSGTISEFEAISMSTEKVLKEIANEYGWIYETIPL